MGQYWHIRYQLKSNYLTSLIIAEIITTFSFCRTCWCIFSSWSRRSSTRASVTSRGAWIQAARGTARAFLMTPHWTGQHRHDKLNHQYVSTTNAKHVLFDLHSVKKLPLNHYLLFCSLCFTFFVVVFFTQQSFQHNLKQLLNKSLLAEWLNFCLVTAAAVLRWSRVHRQLRPSLQKARTEATARTWRY